MGRPLTPAEARANLRRALARAGDDAEDTARRNLGWLLPAGLVAGVLIGRWPKLRRPLAEAASAALEAYVPGCAGVLGQRSRRKET